MANKIEAYEGTENYIFISYAHRDSEQVFPIMEQLRSRGYRIWYDDGIAPGSEWPEDIARHLNGAAMVIAFVSPNSMASVNCRREINFALSKQKPFLSVILQPTEMPLGMELQLSAQQSVIRYNYRTEDAFLEKICACPDLACCKETVKQAEPVPEVKTAPAAVAAPAQMPAAEPKKAAVAAPKQEPVKASAPKVSGKLLGIAAGVLFLVAAVVIFLLAGPKDGASKAPAQSTGPSDTQSVQTQPAQTQSEEITVHVKVPASWTSVSLWAWSDPDGKEAFDAWPGADMKPDGNGWYTGTAPAWINRVCIAGNNGNCESAYVPVEGKEIWIVVREDWTCQTSYEGPFEATVTIYASFDNWTDPHCWAWSTTADAFDAWPGEAFEKYGEWYAIVVPCDTIGIKLSDPDTGTETQDITLEPGWDVWVVWRGDRYAWFYEEPTAAQLKEVFGS